jgi:hypothetical protein
MLAILETIVLRWSRVIIFVDQKGEEYEDFWKVEIATAEVSGVGQFG